MTPINERLRGEEADELFAAILRLQSVEECYRFFEDVCTIAELQAMAQRFAVAKMLASGQTYDEIAAATGVSSATISRVKRALYYGADGYRLVLERLGHEIVPNQPPGRRS